jgi:hypothetical protein
VATVQFSRIAGGVRFAVRGIPIAARASGCPARAGLSKLNSMPARSSRLKSSAVVGKRRSGSVDVLGPTDARAARNGPLAPPGRPKALPRKEVIQPQLPLRLPCYDFTPVTSPTVDGSLPCGLGHRLRVLLTPVV